ncbi:hypothetical protein [Nonomuraea basaltis]|uniref:hypothetical protein n=1 Tax=Nonomuraea basaltis TaxID=2495887 RepID=UPI00110C5D98|nr:hypothetical protein [Nonomuraea basaltis]TMR91797.1 hypothetical protein EJK15_48165 [Nonomuraea basaltis]
MTGVVRRRDRGDIVLSLLVIAAALALTGCSVQADADSGPGSAVSTAGPSGKAPRTYTVEQLAAATGCTAKITLKALDYRKGECTSDGVPYVFLDFDTAEGQREWLDYAGMYGGLYLVGDRWALSAKSKSFMQELSRKFGGTVQEHGPGGSAPSPSSHHDGSAPSPSSHHAN